MGNTDNLMNWFCDWFDKLNARQVQEEVLFKITIVVWCIWFFRCEKAFNNIQVTPEMITHKCRKEISEFEAKQVSTPRANLSISRTNLHWSPPSRDTFKINCDGSFQHINKTGGVGLIICDFAGTHRGSKCIYLNHIWSAEQAKSRGLWEAVHWAKEQKLEKVVFELDSKIVVDAVNNEVFNID
ncbi:uncharacterized protein LOC113338546 [Papaver somniferum]|uniref:uncharacterized protein LOC113338546 n=1 Tax=Papaver somniferum TaxID=3469 RepID=UPI000E6FB378|nr:uncharacterized protein LOC113338546 [Papaver somniferum]